MIDKITCLSYDKRKDMWPPLQEQVQRLFGQPLEMFIGGDGQDPDIKYDHIDEVPPNGIPFLYNLNKGHYNAFLCHKKMAQRAIDEGVKNVLFMEDDSYIIEDRMSILNCPSVQYTIKNRNWDIIYLGWWQKLSNDTSEDRDDLEEEWRVNKNYGLEPIQRPPQVAHEMCGLHGLLINKHFLPAIAQAPIGPIDSLLLRNFDNINAWFLWPKLIHVHSTFSYCENSQANRNKI